MTTRSSNESVCRQLNIILRHLQTLVLGESNQASFSFNREFHVLLRGADNRKLLGHQGTFYQTTLIQMDFLRSIASPGPGAGHAGRIYSVSPNEVTLSDVEIWRDKGRRVHSQNHMDEVLRNELSKLRKDNKGLRAELVLALRGLVEKELEVASIQARLALAHEQIAELTTDQSLNS